MTIFISNLIGIHFYLYLLKEKNKKKIIKKSCLINKLGLASESIKI